ncbi:GAF and ANTAR domain-containing protein [Streptomyces spectabilis]|uniref:ANTAR domain-containing protein n=1 Tax=Streptomyces spectabilis TaxID=68270 RepID=A0A5P2X126_STRST|nr:GAF and ANTAR domain-containing protein [Streptomyces spectabilis]MBB5107940.1 GAF domain-containing protein [Streptomyces spectabilis]MCI3899730.1 GAF and ANTAR domain-containing protein [Streptomyces spectabilis]QEV57404.1 ANTAR domain-containing protein [Streptomyces spectabilis]GGV52153.1 transcription antitermination regulator [Streptomyces spectabilis]
MTPADGGPVDPSSVVDLLLDTETLDDFLNALAEQAMQHAPRADGCGITVQRAGRFLTVTSAGTSASQLDEKQYGLNDGPCLQALRTAKEVHVSDLMEEQRWSSYPAHAIAAGTRSSLSFPIAARSDTAGALNLYSPVPRGFDDADLHTLRALAAQATGAIELAQRMALSRQFTHDVQQALRSRGIIDQAVGIIMAQQRCPSERAFAILRAASQNRNVKLRELCRNLITNLTGQPPHDPPGLQPPAP